MVVLFICFVLVVLGMIPPLIGRRAFLLILRHRCIRSWQLVEVMRMIPYFVTKKSILTIYFVRNESLMPISKNVYPSKRITLPLQMMFKPNTDMSPSHTA